MGEKQSKRPIISAHVHIFRGDHVPPFIARKFLPWPLFYLLNLNKILSFYKWIDKLIDDKKYRSGSFYNRFQVFKNRLMAFVDRVPVINIPWQLLQWVLTLNAVYTFTYWIKTFSDSAELVIDWIGENAAFLFEYCILIDPKEHFVWSLLIFLGVFVFVKSGRNLVVFVAKSLVKFVKKLPGKQTASLLERYLLMAKYAKYKQQTDIFNKLEKQYPKGTKMVVLPMDMKYMGAGKLKSSYYDQMAELEKVKQNNPDTCIPFVFVDPRRISEDGKAFFDYTFNEGKVDLAKGCFVQQYLEDKGFGGIKIYPALGYYPFDERLLPLWKYAADNQIPIMTHCIIGTIFYRGTKEKRWDYHPVFKEPRGDDEPAPLLLSERKNVEFQRNFTHPMNYLCLLEENLLRILVGDAKDDRIRQLFGYTDKDTPLKHNLNHLKVCLAHFGGEEEWLEFLEKDSYQYPLQVTYERDRGVDLSFRNGDGKEAWGRYEQLYRYVDWYTLIYSLLAQFDNMYADLSYIISKPSIYPLLRQTVDPDITGKVSQKVLFGTDFFVVRNHNTDKELMVNAQAALTKDEFDLIARENTYRYLGLD